MIRTMIILSFFLATMGGPQPVNDPMAMEFSADGIHLQSSVQYTTNQLHPVSKLVVTFRDAFRQCRALALTQAPTLKPRPVAPEKEVIICLGDQHLYRFEDGRIISSHPVSSGVPGHRTPTGDYGVYNQTVRAWSNKYECTMLHWMALTPDGMYGMHALKGTSYLRKLGRVASHGCVRLSHDDAELIYGWVEIGMPVTIVAEFDPEPYLMPPRNMIGPVDGFDPGIF